MVNRRLVNRLVKKMKKTAEFEVAESVKLCIELDEEMKEKWEWTKEDLDSTFKLFKKGHIKITNTIVLQCLLYCYGADIEECH